MILLVLGIAPAVQGRDYGALYGNLPVSMKQVSEPVIPERSIAITEFGAVRGELCTEAISDAVEALAAEGGGHLIVPRGEWTTGPIVLRSGIDLHLEKGAVLSFSTDKRLYLVKGKTVPCISAEKCDNISITGSGIIDGNGDWWRYVKHSKVKGADWERYLAMGGTVKGEGNDALWFPYNLKGHENITDSPEAEDALRTHMVVFKRCNAVMLRGVTLRNSPKFHFTPSMCTNVIVDGVTVECPWYAQNGDGIDIGNSRVVLVTGCTLDVGDDAICMKGGSGKAGEERGPCEDVLICGNTVRHGHSGFAIGSDFSGGMRRIVVRDCLFDGTDTGLTFKSMIGRGGWCEDIFIENVRMRGIVREAVLFRCDYVDFTYRTVGAATGVEYVPEFSDISISKIRCRGCATAVRAAGIDGHDCVHDVTIRDSKFTRAAVSTEINGATASISMVNCRYRH